MGARSLTVLFFAMASCRQTVPAPASRPTPVPMLDASVARPAPPLPPPRPYCPSADVLATEPTSAFVGAVEHDLATRIIDRDAPVSDTPASLARIIAADRQIRVDGFMGYLRGPHGGSVRETIAALRRVRSDEAAMSLERSIGIFGARGPSRDDAERVRQIEALGDAAPRFWAALDGVYQRYAGDLAHSLQEWIREEAARLCRDAGAPER